MQKIHEITVVNSKFPHVTDGVYSVNIFCGGNLLRTCQKVLCGGTPQGKFVYALFKNGHGFVIRRKERYIAEQEQSWADVAEVVKIGTAINARQHRKENNMKNKVKLWKVTVNDWTWDHPKTIFARSREEAEEIASRYPAHIVRFAGSFLTECADCHHVFTDEEAHTVLEHHGEFSEPFAACPNCGSFDLDPAECCSSCGEFHRQDELYGSHYGGKMCKGCLRQACDADAFADFGTVGYADDELSDLEAFVLCRILLLPELPKRSSAEFRAEMKRIFWEEVDRIGCAFEFRESAREKAEEQVRVRLFDDWLADGDLDEFADFLFECRALVECRAPKA